MSLTLGTGPLAPSPAGPFNFRMTLEWDAMEVDGVERERPVTRFS